MMKMAMVGCFSGFLPGKKKKEKESLKLVKAKRINSSGDLRVKPEELFDPSIEKGLGKVKSVEDSAWLNLLEKSLPSNIKILSSEKNGNLVRADSAVDAAYEGEDEYDENFSMKRDFSDFDLHALAAQSGENYPHEPNQDLNTDAPENNSKGTTPEVIQSGHVSDPGIGRTTSFLESPLLKRSCSNIETKRASKILKPPIKSNSYDDLENYSGNVSVEATQAIIGSPLSVITSCSADKVMLKKRSSSQVLPSRSRKLWWKLFLWSHRNLHKPLTCQPVQRMISMNNNSNQKGGYCSDTLEPNHVVDLKKKKAIEESEIIRNNIWPQNQWVAFSAESSSLDRVDAWVHSLDDSTFCGVGNSENISFEASEEVFCSTEIGESSNKNHNHNGRRTPEEAVQANTVIHSLNSVSSVAHIAGMGLKVIPPIAPFTSLRSVNLSGNFIVHISPGSLPKSLHTLDLSRNKITTIEGLRDLTRLRILNLSYNKISRIGHGLSNCVVIKELYLAGNKISDVEGLHRLLKLTVLDLSFNKISTAKALGQLVANYNSLLAVNLLGNPIQSNIGDEQLRKSVCGLLPNLAYLNKQPVKPQRMREVATDSVAKAALGGSSSWSSRRKATRRVTQSSAASVKGSSYRGLTNVATKNSKHKSKSRHQPSTYPKK